MKRAKKAVWIGQGDELDALLEAVAAYVKSRGVGMFAAGPVGVRQHSTNTFDLLVRFTGKPPKHGR